MKKYLITFFICALVGQGVSSDNLKNSDYQVSSEKFFTDKLGNIKMVVNVWGHVNSPGLHEVYDGIDLATLLSMVGGPKSGADLKKVKIFRDSPDLEDQMVYYLNLEKFIEKGDRSDFIKIRPNDTIIIRQKVSDYLWSQVSVLNTVLTLANLYFQIQNNK